jgi:cytochrome c peroxidase
LNIGVSDSSSSLSLKYLPVIKLQNKVTGEIKVTTDPGRVMISGLWKDVGRFKGPILRGLASRAPYFHNGSADTLEEVIDFYNKRLNVGITPQERRDLVAFLKAL